MYTHQKHSIKQILPVKCGFYCNSIYVTIQKSWMFGNKKIYGTPASPWLRQKMTHFPSPSFPYFVWKKSPGKFRCLAALSIEWILLQTDELQSEMDGILLHTHMHTVKTDTFVPAYYCISFGESHGVVVESLFLVRVARVQKLGEKIHLENHWRPRAWVFVCMSNLEISFNFGKLCLGQKLLTLS